MLGNILITGGASGLGRACALTVAKEGGRPLVVDVNPPDDGVDHVIADLADRADAERAVTELAERAGGLDAVVTAAGVDACGRLADVSADAWERVIRVNLLGTASVVRAALPYLTASRGRIVTCASTLGVRAVSDATAYCASKFGVVGFTRALAAELAGRVGVTLLIPGGMRTHFFDDRAEQYRPGPDARLNQPEDVAAAVVFALGRPEGCEVRELVVCPATETSWP
ncbi:NAD(P)-dependent dehydrogenase (short-subunit alcohol dehydrogenase family) [Streptosporangium becharense]|uniref:NAD(P)-dependent dehydrogenase (Short-subunit alcohol dehydrogenase family) n=1 Tax=Streptosporangium becharense TaxID=1816182 RepID=A0A7W9IEG7_9ACTN|nr:SDR family oxidoreductase [Streptosporangium becharense]MBB2912041.1 NAD(P)-dependent dehydrogenase (short-subunit alcohol dehydrogenase family) [Streptosporangium becharense]MBB5818588.1 NAD(P)-dependent dehydrogenase (short-subunit alcohol dehydrogenase family) [Streptosporangium becharense]